MNYTVDQSTDHSNRELYHFLTGVDLPIFVKEASIDDIKAPASMAKTAFADQSNGLFPINTKARVYVSNAFFINKKAALTEKYGNDHVNKIEENIKKAADLFLIGDSLEQYNKIANAKLHQGYDDKSVTLKIANDDVELFSIKTATDLSRCAGQFSNTIHKYPYEWRRNIADQFVKAAEEFDVDELPDLVLKYAGYYYPDIEEVRVELARRMTKVSGDNKKRYHELISDIENIGSKEEVFKLAETCYYIEKNAGLYDKPHYRSILGDVVDRFFTLHLDKVAEMLDTIEMGGEKFAMADLYNVPEDIYHKAFGFEISPKSAEAVDILPTLPRSDVSLFKELSGVQPI
jgi:hypothetical protein